MLKAEIIGNLGADAKVVRGNTADFVSLSVAHSRVFKKNDGTEVAETYWVNVTINWNASNLLPYLKKGTKVFVRGNVRLRAFTDKNHELRAGMDINADEIELCGSAQQQQQTPPSNEVGDAPF